MIYLLFIILFQWSLLVLVSDYSMFQNTILLLITFPLGVKDHQTITAWCRTWHIVCRRCSCTCKPDTPTWSLDPIVVHPTGQEPPSET